MKKINVYYAKLNNMGDLLSEYLIPMITGYEAEHCESISKFEVMGVGSCGGALWSGKKSGIQECVKDTLKKIACIHSAEPCAVWGTGFMEDISNKNLTLIRKNVYFIAVRGALSKKIVEQGVGYEIHPVMCDGGILAADLLTRKPLKEHKVGFIPHYNEQHILKKSGIQFELEKRYPNSTVINLRDDPLRVIEEIGKCEYIISSSLHGCVVADSFHIPNVRVRISSIPGTGFKFDDYYSGYGVKFPAIQIDSGKDIPTINQIIDTYPLLDSAIDEKKRQMSECLLNFVSQFRIAVR